MPGELTAEWVTKAEEDWTGVRRLRVGDLSEVANVVAFLSQQCAEKYLKALMQESGMEPPRVHHLPALLDRLSTLFPHLDDVRVACERLSPYGVSFRYPGESATGEEAHQAIALADQIRAVLRHELHLPNDLLSR